MKKNKKSILAYDNYGQPIHVNDKVNLKNGDVAKVVGLNENENLRAFNNEGFEYDLYPYSVIKFN